MFKCVRQRGANFKSCYRFHGVLRVERHAQCAARLPSVDRTNYDTSGGKEALPEKEGAKHPATLVNRAAATLLAAKPVQPEHGAGWPDCQ